MKVSKKLYGKVFEYLVAMLLLSSIFLSYHYRIFALTGKSFSICFLILLTLGTFFLMTFGLYKLKGLLFQKINLFAISILIALPRLLWVFLMPTKPVSDYFCFYSYASKASRGLLHAYDKTFVLFRFRFGYSLILASVFKIFGSSVLVAKLFNVFLSVILGIIIFYTVNYLFGKDAAFYSIILFAFWPSQIMYNSVLASEHPFIVFFMLGLYFIIKGIKEEKINFALLGGFFIAISNHIRPVGVLVIIACLVWAVVCGLNRNLTAIKLALSSLGAYIAAFYTIGYLIFCLTNVPVWQTSMGLNLMIGTDYTTYGMNNRKHSLFVEKFGYDFKKMHQEAMKIGIQRLKKQPDKFLSIIPRKISIIWGDDSFGYFWSTFKVYKNTWFVKFVKSHPTIFYILSQLYYYTILLYIVFASVFRKKNSNDEVILLTSLIFLGYVAAHIFLEVQPRYHYPAIFTLFLLSGMGAEALKKKLKKDLKI